MSKIYCESDVVQVPAPAGGVIEGLFYLIGGLFGASRNTVAAGQLFALDREGVWHEPVAAKAGAALAVGDPVYWSAAGGFTATSGAGEILAGYALSTVPANTTGNADIAISDNSLTTSAEAIDAAGGAEA